MLPHVDVVDVCSPPATHEPVALEAIEAGKHVVIEKPFTGAFGPKDGAFAGNRAAKTALLETALASAGRIVAAARRRGVVLAYAENWIYAPAVQKERDIIEKTDADPGCSGRTKRLHSPTYGIWRHWRRRPGGQGPPSAERVSLPQAGRGARARRRPIRRRASRRTHEITRLPGHRDRGFPRTDYEDADDQ